MEKLPSIKEQICEMWFKKHAWNVTLRLPAKNADWMYYQECRRCSKVFIVDESKFQENHDNYFPNGY